MGAPNRSPCYGDQQTVLGGRWVVVIVGGALASALVACSSPPSLQGVGGRCFQVVDCKLGLVCVPQADGTRACSADLSSIVGTGPPAGAGASGPPMPAEDEAGSDGADAIAAQGDDGSDEGTSEDAPLE
jgi:hypothetical protein